MTGTSLRERQRARVAWLRATLAAAEGELAERRFQASSGAVRAVVDHRARVV